jgi:hypothetical protein
LDGQSRRLTATWNKKLDKLTAALAAKNAKPPTAHGLERSSVVKRPRVLACFGR